jgi:hypothetical protein
LYRTAASAFSAHCVSTTGEAPVTVTFSCRAAMPIATLIVAVKFAVSFTPSRVIVENPGGSNVSLHSPGGTATNL